MKLYKHESNQEYIDAQIKKNVGKLKNVWATTNECNLVASDIKKNIPNVKFGICHGARNGWEVEFFKSKLNISVLGTDISDTALKFKDMIVWDFHDVKEEWIGSVDFIYTNALDHSHTPKKAIESWMSCLTENGRLYVEWSSAHEGGVDAADCFSANLTEYKELFSQYNIEEHKIDSRIILSIYK